MGEYAIRVRDRRTVKVGTCEMMYYLRYEDRLLLKPERGSIDTREATDLFFRPPWVDEDNVRPGDYRGHNREVEIPRFWETYKKIYEKNMDEREIEYYDQGSHWKLAHIKLTKDELLFPVFSVYLDSPASEVSMIFDGKKRIEDWNVLFSVPGVDYHIGAEMISRFRGYEKLNALKIKMDIAKKERDCIYRAYPDNTEKSKNERSWASFCFEEASNKYWDLFQYVGTRNALAWGVKTPQQIFLEQEQEKRMLASKVK